jgi:hypothetical protein
MFIISRLAELGILSVVVFTIELSSTDGVVLAEPALSLEDLVCFLL